MTMAAVINLDTQGCNTKGGICVLGYKKYNPEQAK